ncbi:MAG: PLP-dependent lyase/thiolase, partial [Spirochaetes bacterium]
MNTGYRDLLRRKSEIMKMAVGIDYGSFEEKNISFDYEKMMLEVGYSLDEIREIQGDSAVGSTPLIELKNLTALIRQFSAPGKGARIFLKDEAVNPSGSFKA